MRPNYQPGSLAIFGDKPANHGFAVGIHATNLNLTAIPSRHPLPIAFRFLPPDRKSS
jgi:hypothetical protein